MPVLAQSGQLDVVLVRPRNPLNIGAAARAMANFGFRRLAVVTPYEEHWREAKSAVGAPELLQNAKESAALADAVADCSLVIGTGTLTYRKPEQPVVSLPALAPIIQQEIARGGRVALVFGPEKHGLTREDLSYCHLLVEIPTAPRQPSMNLGQAVAVCLYELAVRLSNVREKAHAAVAVSHPCGGKKPQGWGTETLRRIRRVLSVWLPRQASWSGWPGSWKRPCWPLTTLPLPCGRRTGTICGCCCGGWL